MLFMLAALSCSEGDEAQPRGSDPKPSTKADAGGKEKEGGGGGGGGTTHAPSAELTRCAKGARDLTSITDAIARFKDLAPTDGPCVVASLPRPLAVVATTGVISAQPAGGEGSPRLFFLLPKVVISAVPSGDGSKVIELGEWTTKSNTVKGEIALPIAADLASNAAFERVINSDRSRTVCGSCHRDEQRHPTLTDAFVSAAYRPEPGTFVKLAELEAFHEACGTTDTSPRCAMLHALFDLGDVTEGEFEPEVGTFLSP